MSSWLKINHSDPFNADPFNAALATKRMLPTKMQEAYDLTLPKPGKWWFWAGVFLAAHGAYNLTTSLLNVSQ